MTSPTFLHKVIAFSDRYPNDDRTLSPCRWRVAMRFNWSCLMQTSLRFSVLCTMFPLASLCIGFLVCGLQFSGI